MAPFLNTLHTYSTALFTIYGTLHVLHHFLAATILSPDWHVAMQDQYMPRGLIGEKLLVWLPAGLSYLSGWSLLWKNKTQLVRSVKDIVSSIIKSKIFGGAATTTTAATAAAVSDKKSDNEITNSSLQKIRQVQYLSALSLGVCLSAHLPAVLGLRYAFASRNQEPINVYTACHEMHNSAMPVLFRYIFIAYYGLLVGSFFTHAISGFSMYFIKNGEKKEDPASTAKYYFEKFVFPSIFASFLLGAVTSVGLFLKTNEVVCAAHTPTF